MASVLATSGTRDYVPNSVVSLLPLDSIMLISASTDERGVKQGPGVITLSGKYDGQVIMTSFVNGKKRGKCQWLLESNAVLLQGTFINDELTGVFVLYYPESKQKRMEGECENNLLNGKIVEYDENGNVVFEGVYLKGKRRGECMVNGKPVKYDAEVAVSMLSSSSSSSSASIPTRTTNPFILFLCRFNIWDTKRAIPDGDYFTHDDDGCWRYAIPPSFRTPDMKVGYRKKVALEYCISQPKGMDYELYSKAVICPQCMEERLVKVKKGEYWYMLIPLLLMFSPIGLMYLLITTSFAMLSVLPMLFGVYAFFCVHKTIRVRCEECHYEFGSGTTMLMYYVPYE